MTTVQNTKKLYLKNTENKVTKEKRLNCYSANSHSPILRVASTRYFSVAVTCVRMWTEILEKSAKKAPSFQVELEVNLGGLTANDLCLRSF